MTEKSDLIPGAFYWAFPVNDPDIEFAWEWYPQPARFVGFDKHGQEQWNWLNVEGVSLWPARWVGDRLICPAGDEEERLSCGEKKPEWAE